MNISDIMRQYMTMLEDALDPKKIDQAINSIGGEEEPEDVTAPDLSGRDAAGRASHPDIEFEELADKTIARLRGNKSGYWTKLAQQILEIKRLEEQVKKLKDEVKNNKLLLLFSAADAVRTRVVETLRFIFVISKDPKPTETYKYAEILKELEGHLLPEQVVVLKAIKEKFKSETQKSASMTITAREGINEANDEAIEAFYAKFNQVIMNWAHKYDAQLESLKQEAGV